MKFFVVEYKLPDDAPQDTKLFNYDTEQKQAEEFCISVQDAGGAVNIRIREAYTAARDGDVTDEERIAYWKGVYDRMAARSIEDAAEIERLRAELADHRNGTYLVSVIETRERFRKALIEASTHMKNARGAVESNQVADKDVWGTLSRGITEIRAVLEATHA